MDAIEYQPFAPQVRANPYPYYARLREHAPAYWIPSLQCHAFSRYEDVLAILKNPAVFSSDVGSVRTLLRDRIEQSEELSRSLRAPTLVSLDPPRHTRLRGLVNRAFTSARVAALEPRIREVARTLLRHAIERGQAAGALDFMEEFASPLPVIIIAEMLGVEPERRSDFRHWSNNAISAAARIFQGEDHVPIEAGLRELRLYMEGMIEARRREPRNDLISALVEAEEETSVLTAEEVVSFTQLLLVAGNETTTNLLGNALVALLAHPGELARLQRDPAAIPAAVEETLRFDSPVHGLFRITTEEVRVADAVLPPGSTALMLLASANRDERKFPEPDRFDLDRDTQGAIAFGHGIHFCLGAALSRLEARVALEELFAATRSLSYAPGQEGQIDWGDPSMVRGPRSLRLGLEPA